MIVISTSNPGPFEEINSNVILVPAEIAARSRPSSHSVPIVRPRKKIKRRHIARNVILAIFASQLVFAGVITVTYYSIEAGHDAGYKLACSTVGIGRYAYPECHWEKM